MNAISDKDPYVEGSQNKHWWRQVEAGMCSAMQHTISIRTLKHRANLLDARGVQQTSIGFVNRAHGARLHATASKRLNAHTTKPTRQIMWLICG